MTKRSDLFAKECNYDLESWTGEADGEIEQPQCFFVAGPPIYKRHGDVPRGGHQARRRFPAGELGDPGRPNGKLTF